MPAQNFVEVHFKSCVKITTRKGIIDNDGNIIGQEPIETLYCPKVKIRFVDSFDEQNNIRSITMLQADNTLCVFTNNPESLDFNNTFNDDSNVDSILEKIYNEFYPI